MATGWVDFPEGKRYFDANGWMHVGWMELSSKRYCFDREGLMVTGWQELQGQRYYFTAGGELAVGWQETELGRFYFDENNQIRTGWLRLPEGTWYLQEDGSPYTGWKQTEDARYYFLEDGRMATGLVEVAGIQRLFSTDGNYIPLINAKNTIPGDFIPNLVTIEGFLVDSTCVEALAALMADARAAGLICVLNSTYRDIATQEYLWNRRYNDYLSKGCTPEEAYALSIRRVMYPGASEHHSGLAIDIKGSEELYQWFRDHAWEYGFHPRYPGEKEPFTGVRDEPWHLRYMGKEIAQILQESGLCFEEYLDQLKV